MPELPEVHTIVECLSPRIVGRRVESVWVRRGSRLFRDTLIPARRMADLLPGKKIWAIGRLGKYIRLSFSSSHSLVVHLGMTGQLYVIDHGQPSPSHAHLRLGLDDGHDLIMVDPRTFGRLIFHGHDVPDDQVPGIKTLGRDPLLDDLSAAYLLKAFAGRTAPVKALLLSQSIVAGVGNIYADEACHRARLLPHRPAGSLTKAEVAALRRSIREVLMASIECKGTTFRDYQWDAGKTGDFVSKLRVYGREGKECKRCRGAIEREVLAGRSTFFCRGCQQ